MNVESLIELLREGENERVEFKAKATSNIAREICAMANAEGGYLLIGVSDEGRIVGVDTKKAKEVLSSALQNITPPISVKTNVVRVGDKDVLVVEVPRSKTLCSIGGVAYIRIGSSIRPLSVQEILMLSAEMGTVTWDEFPLVDLSEMKNEYVEWFFSALERARGRKIPREDWMRYLRSSKAVKGERLTNAGVLFFTDATDFIPHSGGRIVWMQGDEAVKSVEFSGPVWRVVDDMFYTLTREFRTYEVVVGTKRVKLPEYPPRAVREALINAFAHRNYAIPADVRVFVYPDRLVIRNPGGLMPGVDLNDPEHVPRNPNLCSLLYDAGYIEKYGYGLRMIREECKKHGLVGVEFKTRANRFEVIFHKWAGRLLDELDRKILSALETPRRSGELAEELGISKPTLLKRLKKLEGWGLVRSEGRGSQRRYLLNR
ncbi:transcriptional regulator [Thermococcus profundus]|uniref:Transcriptional regulator n=1 Tax=Thermococcus profundus TaxID=49899 RepID=A0A2Z2MCX3_THEPR|nr:helix-turn-helix domain-containing protein [Thermococcus profundus]ASJ03359.1 transcriptional regulator [Thermococcus profundus]